MNKQTEENFIPNFEDNKNGKLRKAQKNKNDEFYTRLEDIEAEFRKDSSYKEFFKGKTVFLNCDDPEESNFWKFFELNFDRLGLKKLVSTHYDNKKPTYKLELYEDLDGDGYRGHDDIIKTPLTSNGDFRSPECIDILKEADVVVTNPPFSLFREYVKQLIDYNKYFLIVGNQNAITYKEIFPLIKEQKMWVGYNFIKEFIQPNGSVKKFGNICWFTNIPIKRTVEQCVLTASYYDKKNKRETYEKYDNYDAINVDKVINIPNDYYEEIGVPITFIEKYCPEQFKIIDGIGRYSILHNEETKAEKNIFQWCTVRQNILEL